METQKEFLTLLNYAYRYISYRMRTEKEVRTYLEQKAEKKCILKDFINNVLVYLIENKYINDDIFIEEYVSARSKGKPKSQYVLTLELLQKGIKSDKIDSYFENNVLDEEALARRALQKKWKTYSHLPRLIRFKKASDFLRRRGFNFSIVKKTIEELET